MKKFLFGILMLLTMTSLAYSQEIKLATGSETGVYNTVAGPKLKEQMGKMPLSFVTSNGSLDNIEKLNNKEVTAAFVQMDALAYSPKSSDLAMVKTLYPEYVYLIARTDSPDSIKDFDFSKTKFAIGKDGSGTYVTWKTISATSKSGYDKIATIPVGGSRAIALLESREVDGVLLIGGLGMGDVARANQDKGKFKLVALDDKNFTSVVYKGQNIYTKAELSEKQFPGLIKAAKIGTNTVQTLTVPAALVTTADFADNNQGTFDKLFDAATRAIPNIIQALNEKKN